MKRLNVVELKNSLGDVLNKAEYQGERIIVHRRGKDSAAIISISDLRLFELLIEEAEDRLDVEAARKALRESVERIHYEEFRRQQGLNDEPKPKKRHSTTGAGTKTV
jgi:prevent-host-death family protein